MSLQLVTHADGLILPQTPERTDHPVTEIRYHKLLVILSDESDSAKLAMKVNPASEKVVGNFYTPETILALQRRGSVCFNPTSLERNFDDLTEVFVEAIQGSRAAQEFYEWARQIDLRDSRHLVGEIIVQQAHRDYAKIDFLKHCEDAGIESGTLKVPALPHDFLLRLGVISLGSYGMAQAVFKLLDNEEKIPARLVRRSNSTFVNVGVFSAYDRTPVGRAALEVARKVWDVMLRARIFEDYFESNQIPLSKAVKDGLFKNYLDMQSPWDFLSAPQIIDIENFLAQLDVHHLRLTPDQLGKAVGSIAFSANPVATIAKELHKRLPPVKAAGTESAASSLSAPVSTASGTVVLKAAIREALDSKFVDMPGNAKESARMLLWELYKRFRVNVTDVFAFVENAESLSQLITTVERWKKARIDNSGKRHDSQKASKHTHSLACEQEPRERWSLDYLTVGSSVPFRDWFNQQDDHVRTVIDNRLRQMAAGNLGRYAPVGDSKDVFVNFSHKYGGARIYFYREGTNIIVLLGGKEGTQHIDCCRALEYAGALSKQE